MEVIKVECDEYLQHVNMVKLQSNDQCVAVNEQIRDSEAKEELDCYKNEPFSTANNIESIQESDAHNECINEVFFKHEQNFSSHDQLCNEVKQEIDNEQDTNDALFKEEWRPNIQECNDVGICEQSTAEATSRSKNGSVKSKRRKKKRDSSSIDDHAQNSSDHANVIWVKSEVNNSDYSNINKSECDEVASGVSDDSESQSYANMADITQYLQCHLGEQGMFQRDHLRHSVHCNRNNCELSSCPSESTGLERLSNEERSSTEDFSVTHSKNLKSHLSNRKSGIKSDLASQADTDLSSQLYVDVRSQGDADRLKSRQYECRKCDYAASTKYRMKNHVEAVHLKLKNYKCDLCDYTAYYKGYVKDHVKAAHSDQKSFKCETCDYETSRKSHFTFHVNTVHLKLKSFKCEMCDYAAAKKLYLKSHVEAVHAKQNSYACGLSDYRASRDCTVEAQADSVDSDQKSFKCDECEYKTSKKSFLNCHVNAVHLKLKKHKCKMCDYESSRKYDLSLHINAVHLKLKNFQCQICEYATTRKDGLKKHIKAVHSKLEYFKCS